MFAQILMVQLAKLHQYFCARDMAAPIGEETLTSCKFSDFDNFSMSAARLHWCKIACSTNIVVHYKDKQSVSNTLPIQLDIAYSIGWSKRKRKCTFFKQCPNLQYSQKNLDHHSGSPLANICHLPALPLFSPLK
jgi:hypothetical protein